MGLLQEHKVKVRLQIKWRIVVIDHSGGYVKIFKGEMLCRGVQSQVSGKWASSDGAWIISNLDDLIHKISKSNYAADQSHDPTKWCFKSWVSIIC
jgi:hypothetical protein